MKKILHIGLLMLAIVVVSCLGYYAWNLSQKSLKMQFNGATSQKGSMLRVFLDTTGILFHGQDLYLNHEHLVKSITKNGLPYSATPEEIQIYGLSFIFTPRDAENGDIFIVNSTIYNQLSSEDWQLPRNITFTYEDTTPEELNITRIGTQKEYLYESELYSYTNLDIQDITWYINTRPGASTSCSEKQLWIPTQWEKLYSTTEEVLHIGNKKIGTLRIDNLSEYPNDSCIIGGIGGNVVFFPFKKREEFQISGSFTDILSPAHNMNTRLRLQFTSPVFGNQNNSYQEEQDTKEDSKTALLKHIHISPEISLTEDTIEIQDNNTIYLSLPLEEREKYSIEIQDLEDIYGRKSSYTTSIIPEQSPLLEMKIFSGNILHNYKNPIGAAIFRAKNDKNEYMLKVCRLNLDAYTIIEYKKQQGGVNNQEYISHLLDTKPCIKKEISFHSGSSIAQFHISDFWNGNFVPPGMYILTFDNKNDTSGTKSLVFGELFSVIDTSIILKETKMGTQKFFVYDSNTGEPRGEQSILIKYLNPEYTNLSGSGKVWQSEKVIGNTTKDGTLTFSGGYSGTVVFAVHNQNHFGYITDVREVIDPNNTNSPSVSSKKEYRVTQFYTDKKNYAKKGEIISIKATIQNHNNDTYRAREKFDIHIINSHGKKEISKTLESNEYGSIYTQIVTDNLQESGVYQIQIEKHAVENIIEDNIIMMHIGDNSESIQVSDLNLWSTDIVNGEVKNIRSTEQKDKKNPWYEKTYQTDIVLQGSIRGTYSNGQALAHIPFSYAVYKTSTSTSIPQAIEAGEGHFDDDGYGFIYTELHFSTSVASNTYTVKLYFNDPITGASISREAEISAKIPATYQIFDSDNLLKGTLRKNILRVGEEGILDFTTEYPPHGSEFNNQYIYSIIKEGENEWDQSKTLREGLIKRNTISFSTKEWKPGQYSIITYPALYKNKEIPVTLIRKSDFVILGGMHKQKNITIIPEQSEYVLGELKKIFIGTPLTDGGNILIIEEGGERIAHQYMSISGSNMLYTPQIQDEKEISLTVIVWEKGQEKQKNTAIGTLHISTKTEENQGSVKIYTNKESYEDTDKMSLEVQLLNQKKENTPGEFDILISEDTTMDGYQEIKNTYYKTLSKIDTKMLLSMGGKMYQSTTIQQEYQASEIKNIPTYKEPQEYLRHSPEKTLFYSPSVPTDGDGNKKLQVPLKGGNGRYHISIFGHTKEGKLLLGEKIIQVEKPYKLTLDGPSFLYPYDNAEYKIQLSHISKNIEATILNIGVTLSGKVLKKESIPILLQPGQEYKHSFPIEINPLWIGNLSLETTLSNGKEILDSQQKNITVIKTPVFENGSGQYTISRASEWDRVIEFIDREKGMDTFKNWNSIQPLENLILKKGGLYRIVVQGPKMSPEEIIHGTELLPGGYSIIPGSIQSYNSQTPFISNIGTDKHQFSGKNDKNDFLFSYLIEPKYSGKYMLPPIIIQKENGNQEIGTYKTLTIIP